MNSVYMKYSLDLDLITSEYIENKCKNPIYAQNLYAAMCNNWFEKAGLEWTTSWRGAGSIIATIRNCREDYIDWYCSGISALNTALSVLRAHLSSWQRLMKSPSPAISPRWRSMARNNSRCGSDVW